MYVLCVWACVYVNMCVLDIIMYTFMGENLLFNETLNGFMCSYLTQSLDKIILNIAVDEF